MCVEFSNIIIIKKNYKNLNNTVNVTLNIVNVGFFPPEFVHLFLIISNKSQTDDEVNDHLMSSVCVMLVHLVGTSDRSCSIGSSPLVSPESSLLFSSSVAWSSGTRKSSGLWLE